MSIHNPNPTECMLYDRLPPAGPGFCPCGTVIINVIVSKRNIFTCCPSILIGYLCTTQARPFCEPCINPCWGPADPVIIT